MKTIINIKTDKGLKTKAQKVARDLGIPLSTAINAFLRQMVRDKEIIFSSKKYRMTPYLERLIGEAREEYEAGDFHGPFNSAEGMIADLKSRKSK